MKVVHLNKFDTKGGASKAMMRIHHALIGSGVDSVAMVQKKYSKVDSVFTDDRPVFSQLNKLLSKIDSIPTRLIGRSSNNFSPSFSGGLGIINKINSLNPDIVHLHWVCDGMISIKNIARIHAPVVWTLHDNWAFSGGCHNMSFCNHHDYDTHQCGFFSTPFYKMKAYTYNQKRDLSIVSPSRWLYEQSKSSPLLKSKDHFHIPNPIENDLFNPINKIHSREIWKLPTNKKIILCGAVNVLTDPNKGFNLFLEAANFLEDDDIELVIFGSNEHTIPLRSRHNLHYIRSIDDDLKLNTLYDAADVVVVPSLQENFSNVILESLSSGTPVVAFDVGGNKDLIHNDFNGFLAEPFKTKDLSKKILYALEEAKNYQFSLNARQSTKKFNFDTIADSYKQMYIGLLDALK